MTYLNVDENGVVDLEELKQAIRPDTILISIMFANNEIGTMEPVREIGEIAKEHGILFHTDAVQAFGQIPIQVDELHIDMLSASGHKLNGPKGIGFLYIRKGLRLKNFVHGGAQEKSAVPVRRMCLESWSRNCGGTGHPYDGRTDKTGKRRSEIT